MIPHHLRSKMGKYDVEIQGVQFKVSVIDHPALLDDKISQLKRLLQNHVAGLDVNFIVGGVSLSSLNFCVGNVCLIIVKSDTWSPVTDIRLRKFLSDESICFGGTQMSSKVRIFNSYSFGPCRTEGIISSLPLARISGYSPAVSYESIGFVGREIRNKVNTIKNAYLIRYVNESLKSGVELGDLAASILWK
ncbi:hypothetical protein Patl1_22438 [Pistacia atlantica]|uniref:Uncharacterized protein n=1 Tax=Pistacia atlantica TaxID=434234 RepID=A0ACC0ZXC6_9ROSI|nr:hypothetical protein Patl1_22438 [Pistacia atlantica]